MAQTVIARVPFLNRLRNSYEKTVNIAPLGGIFNWLERCPVTDLQLGIDQAAAVSSNRIYLPNLAGLLRMRLC